MVPAGRAAAGALAMMKRQQRAAVDATEIILYTVEKSFRRGASYVVTMVAEFDEYTNDWLYLCEGTVLPKPSYRKRKSSDSAEFSVWPNVSVRGGEHPGSSSEAPAMLVPTLVPARSVWEAIQEVKMVQIWENVMKSCEQRGRDLLNLNVITSVDLTEWLRTKDSGNETINLGLPSYDMLCTVLHSIKAGSTGLLLGNDVEVDQQNRPQDLLLDWFFHPVLVLKDQMQVLKMTGQEVRFLERLTLFVGSSSATAGGDVWDNGAETPCDPVRMAQIERSRSCPSPESPICVLVFRLRCVTFVATLSGHFNYGELA
ncbi:hypothetical protein ZWY2020_057967 [Hordeum vulgare]|nr:hypothetical protein ZWY2020_057967 [Hordeum vulgare]